MIELVSEALLTPEQQAAVSLPLEEAHLVLGPLGSGKSNVLARWLQRHARRMETVVEDVAVLVPTFWSKTLVGDALVAAGLSSWCVETTYRWYAELHYEHISRNLPLHENGQWYDWDAVRAVVLAHMLERPDLACRYRIVVVDDAQFLAPEELAMIRHLARHLVVFADPDPARYGARSTATQIAAAVGLSEPSVKLPFSLRCSQDVARLASWFLPEGERGAWLQVARGHDPVREKPSVLLVRSTRDEKALLESMLDERRLLGGALAVLSPAAHGLPGLGWVRGQGEYLHLLDTTPDGWAATAEDLRAYYGTVESSLRNIALESARGGTFDAVVIPRLAESWFPHVTGDARRRLLFESIARARRWVCLCSPGKDPIPEVALLEAAAAAGDCILDDRRDPKARKVSQIKQTATVLSDDLSLL